MTPYDLALAIIQILDQRLRATGHTYIAGRLCLTLDEALRILDEVGNG